MYFSCSDWRLHAQYLGERPKPCPPDVVSRVQQANQCERGKCEISHVPFHVVITPLCLLFQEPEKKLISLRHLWRAVPPSETHPFYSTWLGSQMEMIVFEKQTERRLEDIEKGITDEEWESSGSNECKVEFSSFLGAERQLYLFGTNLVFSRYSRWSCWCPLFEKSFVNKKNVFAGAEPWMDPWQRAHGKQKAYERRHRTYETIQWV